MKYLISFIFIIILSLILGPFLPWWSIVIAPFLAGIIFSYKSAVHLLIGFLSIFALWGTQAVLANNQQAADLTTRIGELFSGLTPIVLIIVTAILGGLYGSLAQLTGYLLKQIIKK